MACSDGRGCPGFSPPLFDRPHTVNVGRSTSCSDGPPCAFFPRDARPRVAELAVSVGRRSRRDLCADHFSMLGARRFPVSVSVGNKEETLPEVRSADIECRQRDW
jgi:hypothetical protein